MQLIPGLVDVFAEDAVVGLTLHLLPACEVGTDPVHVRMVETLGTFLDGQGNTADEAASLQAVLIRPRQVLEDASFEPALHLVQGG